MNTKEYSKTHQEAYAYAKAAHESIGQKRKYTNEPYFNHPARVVSTLVSAGETDPAIIQAAYMHDVIEDVFPKNPRFNRQGIQNTFGRNVLAYVEELTDDFTAERYPQFNRQKRKGLEAVRLSKVSLGGKKIKLADIIDNTSDIIKNDPGFAQSYVREKKVLLDNIKQEVEASSDMVLKKLFNQALGQVEPFLASG